MPTSVEVSGIVISCVPPWSDDVMLTSLPSNPPANSLTLILLSLFWDTSSPNFATA
jgi:hypothetical protein